MFIYYICFIFKITVFYCFYLYSLLIYFNIFLIIMCNYILFYIFFYNVINKKQNLKIMKSYLVAKTQALNAPLE